MKAPTKKIWVTMIAKSREELRFKVKPTQGVFKWGGEETCYLVRQDRASVYKGKPSYRYRQGDAEPLDPYGGAIQITAEELNEIGGNQYVRQVLSSFRNNLTANLQWVLIGIMALGIVINFYFGNETSDAVTDLRAQLYQAHPPPAPAPTPGR